MAVARAIEAYLRDVKTYLEAEDGDEQGYSHESLRDLVARITEHRKRIEALDGTVAPRDAERLVRATQDLWSVVSTGDDAPLAAAEDRLDEIV